MYGYGAKLPLARNDIDGNYELIKDLKNLSKQNLKMLILTSPGERIMNPKFGVGIRKFLFEFKDSYTKQQIANKIIEQTNKYLPYISITSITYPEQNNSNPYDGDLNIRIEFFSRTSNESDILNLSF
jgi:phage baseplate assembly protein W